MHNEELNGLYSSLNIVWVIKPKLYFVLIVRPKWVSKDKFTKYIPEFSYFRLMFIRRNYMLLISADLTQ